MPDKENIIKALRICVPETQNDSILGCNECPYVDVCDPNDIVGITLPLLCDIRTLLKEQETVEPITAKPIVFGTGRKCSKCDMYLFPAGRYCPHCGRLVQWDE